jgi:hypothetical protein
MKANRPKWYVTCFMGPDGNDYAGPMILSDNQDKAQAFADRHLRSHNDRLINVLGYLVKDPEISKEYVKKEDSNATFWDRVRLYKKVIRLWMVNNLSFKPSIKLRDIIK